MAVSRILATFAVAVAAVACLALAQQDAYKLPADADLLLPFPIRTTFSCQNRIYGYYADTDNECQIFHVCHPIVDDIGNIIETAHFSFICPNQTIFSQDTLTCSHTEDAFPCAQASTLYDVVNAEFGRVQQRQP